MQDKSFEATSLKAAIATAKSSAIPAVARPAGPPAGAPAAGAVPAAGHAAADGVPAFTSSDLIVFHLGADLDAVVRIRNWNYVTPPHPSTMVDPLLPGHTFWAAVFIGQPVGIIHDVKMLIDLLMEQSEVWFVIYPTFQEALGSYRTQFFNGFVRIAPLMWHPMTALLSGTPSS
ncbi:hypothetical protein CVT26_001664 [Gymnopilus dilepis]|uniref:Uncharacterized protein n=1 Tax=Gymnopilus dilepis TaxID=231916 RepID=A0A409YXD1_9AGAR|nr:hypothetical protein CVT26_001664 [Gymnopilus dilepis]